MDTGYRFAGPLGRAGRPWPAVVALLGVMLLPARAPGQNPNQPPPNPVDPVAGINALVVQLAQLAQQRLLSEKQRQYLSLRLESARLSLFEVDHDGASDAMADVKDRLTDLVEKRALSPKQGVPLIGLAAAVQTSIEVLFNPTPPAVLCPLVWPALSVDDDAQEGGDGSPDRPFRTIAEALDRAEVRGFSAVSIQLAGGFYRAHIEITRNTRFVGQDPFVPVIEGSIHNRGPHCLELDSLAIRGDPDPDSLAGAVLVIHPDARTHLKRVFISKATGFGLMQDGGRLVAESLSIDRTRPLAEPVGVAMRLSGGSTAHLQRVSLTRNTSTENVAVLDVLDQTAVAKVTASWGIDYMLLGKYDGRWKTVQILWQSHPPKTGTAQ